MSVDLLDLINEQVTGTLSREASSFLGESESGIVKAISGIIPIILGSTIEKSSTSNGAASIMDMIEKLDVENLNHISEIFKSDATRIDALQQMGGGIIGSLFGKKTSSIIDFFTNMSGLKDSSVDFLLKMVAPLSMGIIRNHVSFNRLNTLTDLLMHQKSNVANAMPAGLGNLVGLSFATGSGVKSSTAPGSTSITGYKMLKWLLPMVFLFGAFLTYKSCESKRLAVEMAERARAVQDSLTMVAKLADEAAAKMKADAEATMNAMKEKFSIIDARAKTILDKLKFDVETAPGKMKSYIDGGFNGDALFQFKNLNFASESAKLNLLAAAEVDQVAAILKAYPAINIEINGHTDSDGDAVKNKDLSAARANAVMARLIGRGGIDASRLKANGYGSEQPIADNDTPAGKAQNRRIEIKVVQ